MGDLTDICCMSNVKREIDIYRLELVLECLEMTSESTQTDLDFCSDTACIMGLVFGLFVYTALFSLFAWSFPLVVGGSDGKRSRGISILLAVFLTPVYAILYAYQFPIDKNQPIVSVVIALFFWPFAFILPCFNGDTSIVEASSAKVSNSYSEGQWV